MPELPEVEAARRELEPAMQGARFERVTLHRPDLRQPFPRRFRSRLEGRHVEQLSRRAKYLLARLSSGDTLVMHLGMSGSFRVEWEAGRASAATMPQGFDQAARADAARMPQGFDQAAREDINAGRHDHVVFDMSSGATVFFNDPRRFGFMALMSPAQLAAHTTLGALGPEPLSPEFDGAVLARACRGKKTSLKVALMDQQVVAGLGNIYVSEALHLAGLSPHRRASTIAMPSGTPREAAHRLAAAIKRVLEEAIARTTGDIYRAAKFRVYDRAGERCAQRGCGGVIRRQTQAGRSTFYCRQCQR